MSALASYLRAGLDPVLLFERAFGLAAHPWQVAFLREDRPTVLVKSRQIGASTAAAAQAIHCAIYRPGSLSAIVSPSLNQSREVAHRARAGLLRLGERLDQDSASTLRLANGSRILSLPGSPKSVRGWSADLLVLDEASYILPETWVAARSLIAATGGRLLVQSTPAGASGAFYDLVQATDPDWARFSVPATSVSSISGEFLSGERRAMSVDAYAAEYECEFGRGAGASLFSVDRLRDLILKEQSE